MSVIRNSLIGVAAVAALGAAFYEASQPHPASEGIAYLQSLGYKNIRETKLTLPENFFNSCGGKGAPRRHYLVETPQGTSDRVAVCFSSQRGPRLSPFDAQAPKP